jgi:hypothetical protein
MASVRHRPTRNQLSVFWIVGTGGAPDLTNVKNGSAIGDAAREIGVAKHSVSPELLVPGSGTAVMTVGVLPRQPV